MTVRRCSLRSSGDTTTQGRAFWISAPRVGSTSTRSTSPRRTSLAATTAIRPCRSAWEWEGEQSVAALAVQLPSGLRPPAARRLLRNDDDGVAVRFELDLVGQACLLDHQLGKPDASRVTHSDELGLHRRGTMYLPRRVRARRATRAPGASRGSAPIRLALRSVSSSAAGRRHDAGRLACRARSSS